MWSYDPTDLTKSTESGRINIVRFLVGDTESSKPQVQNEEITFALLEESDNVYSAASYIAETLASKYSKLVTTELDGQLTVEYSSLAKNYRTLAGELSRKAKSLSAKLSASGGGLSVEGSFSRYQFENSFTLEDFLQNA